MLMSEAKYRTTMDWTENIDWEIKIKPLLH